MGNTAGYFSPVVTGRVLSGAARAKSLGVKLADRAPALLLCG